MAGVPPFLGFFTKLFLMLLLLNNSFFLLFYIFFILLFLGLYFYIQNIKFLHSSNLKNTESIYLLNNEKLNVTFLYFTINVILLLTLGLFLIDDIMILFTWFFY
jgi:NADH-quinone oxidoreductase subunit N